VNVAVGRTFGAETGNFCERKGMIHEDNGCWLVIGFNAVTSTERPSFEGGSDRREPWGVSRLWAGVLPRWD
jgi:hypothetical protein